MKRLLLLVLATAALLMAAYSPYFTDAFTTINLTNWYQNGTLTATGGGLVVSGSSTASLISKVAIPDGTSDGQIEMILTLGTSGGVYISYLRSNSAATTYYSVELQNPTFSGEFCSATLAINKVVSGVVTTLSSSLIPCFNGMQIRSTVRDSNLIIVRYGDVNEVTFWVYDSSSPLTTGAMGIGGRSMPSGNSVSQAALFSLDRTAPSPVSQPSIGTTVFSNEVDAQWQGALDDPNGVGVGSYKILRNGVFYRYVNTPDFADDATSPSTTYTYTIYALDYHLNASTATTFTVTTPTAATSVNPRRVGVRSTGSYWGGGGEQIDMLTGNLNFTIPLFSAQGRGGWSVPFALTYNSMLWRQDPGGTWKLGRDDGYGFGWRLAAGSVTPYWSDQFTVGVYIYTDATGTEYRLDVNTNGIWTSPHGTYVAYDAFNNVLHFPDGSFWVMGAVAAGTEQDAGTRYPTLMEDTNGNQVLVRYNAGISMAWPNTSARVNEVEDVRAIYNPTTQTYRSYAFTYNGDAIPHLTQISNTLGKGMESYTLGYVAQTMGSPFSPPVTSGTTTLLQSLAVTNLGYGHSFQYGTNSAQQTTGELTSVTFPYGGMIRWTYRNFTFASGETMREVQNRYLTMNPGGTEIGPYALTRNDALDATLPLHSGVVLDDPGGIGEKAWTFSTTFGPTYPFVTRYEERPSAAQASQPLLRKDYTWVTDSAGNAYISTVVTTNDPASANWQVTTSQVVDTHGNVTQSNLGPLSAPGRSYNNTYFADPNYTSRYIFNRLQSSTVTDNVSQSIQLVWNNYDGYATTQNCTNHVAVLYDATGIREHDSSYGRGFYYRGNVTSRSTPDSWTCVDPDITGSPVNTSDDYGYWLYNTQSTTTNYAAPTAITPNTNTNLQVSATYTPWLVPASITQPNSATASTSYDQFGRPQISTSVYGAQTSYAFSQNGSLPMVVTATTNSHWVQTTLDGFGRATSVVRGNGGATVSTVNTVYAACACSPLGKVQKVSQPYAPGGTVYWTVYTYDGMGRTVSVVSPDGASTTVTAYSGNTTTITDPAGKWKKQTFGAAGNMIQVNEPNPAGGADYVTSYTYTILDRLSTVTMTRPTGTQTHTFSYDPTTQRLSSETHPETGTTSYTYNGNGTVASKTDAKGQKTQYVYDTYKRVTQVQYLPDGIHEDTCQRMTFTYDTNSLDGTFTQNGWGRRTTAQWGCTSSSQFTHMYSYTPGGQMNKKRLGITRSPNPPNLKTYNLDAGYAYDTEGRVTTMTYPNYWAPAPQSGVTYTYSYDAMERPVGMVDNQSSPVTWAQSVTYNAADQLTQLTYGSGNYYETRQYNSLLQMTRQTVAPSHYDVQYGFSATQNNGKVGSTYDSVTGETVSYTYDSLNRLSTANANSWGETFAYDGFGNLTDKTPTGSAPALHVAVNASNNQLVGYGYDANGNMTSGGNSYDVANRLVTMKNGNNPAEQYSYGPGNQRVWKIQPDGTESLYFYGAFGELLGEYPIVPASAPTYYYPGPGATRLYFAGKLINGVNGAVVQDRLGSVAYEPVGVNLRYYPWGEEYTTTTQNQEKFGTYYRDKTTALDYAQNRYYSSILGRFLTADPYRGSRDLANPGSLNRYAYAWDDPVNSNDPTGLCIINGEEFPDPCFGVSNAPDPQGPGSFIFNEQYLATFTGAWNAANRGGGGTPANAGTSFANAQNAFQNDAKALAKKKFSKNCDKDLAAIAVTDDQVHNGAANAVFLNGVGSGVMMSSLYATSPVASVRQAGKSLTGTVGGFITSNPGTVAVAQLGGPDIYLNAALINPTDYYTDMATVLHEVLHNVSGLTDPDLQRRLGLPESSVTDNITKKLLNDCF